MSNTSGGFEDIGMFIRSVYREGGQLRHPKERGPLPRSPFFVQMQTVMQRSEIFLPTSGDLAWIDR